MAAPYSVFNGRSLTDANAPAFNFVAITGTPTVYSEPWTGEDSDGFGMTVFTTGTLTGTFTLWGTDKPLPDLTNDNDWVQDLGFTPTNPAGAAVKFRDDVGNYKAAKKRLKYVNAAGAGNIQAFVNVPKVRGI